MSVWISPPGTKHCERQSRHQLCLYHALVEGTYSFSAKHCDGAVDWALVSRSHRSIVQRRVPFGKLQLSLKAHLPHTNFQSVFCHVRHIIIISIIMLPNL